MSFARSLYYKYGEKIFDTAAKTGLDALKAASRKLFNKAADATGGFVGNKIAHKIVKPKPAPHANLRNVGEIPREEREKILKELRQVL